MKEWKHNVYTIALYMLTRKRHFYKFGGLQCPSSDESVLDSYEWWTSCIKAMRELIAGLKLGLNKSSAKHITGLEDPGQPCAPSLPGDHEKGAL